MNTPITLLAPIKLAQGKTEADLIAASDRFQQEFVNQQTGLIRRELVRKSDSEYLDIIQFRSMEDAERIIENEKTSEACHAFFSVMQMDDQDATEAVEFYQSLATYS